MVLDKLGSGLKDALQKITKLGIVDKAAVKELSEDIKKTLVSSDVNFKLAKDVAEKIEKRALSEKPAQGLTAREHTVNIVYDEITNLLGKKHEEIKIEKKPTVLMMVGLFGSGKTTTTGKLAKMFKRQGKKVALVQTDTWRPAAYDQLKQLSEAVKVDFFGDPQERNPSKIIKANQDKFANYDVVVIDTAGRDALNDELVEEIKTVAGFANPDETLLVLPADIGQAAETQAAKFHETLGVTGVIVTKLDGTAKGGGALSACSITGATVKLIGVGEKLDDLEEFKPKNFVGRLLGMGDLEALLKKAETAIDKEQAEKMSKKVMKGELSLSDLYEQMSALGKMGSFGQLASLIPGMGGLIPKGAMKEQEDKMKVWKYMMDSMTPHEKDNPEVITQSRIKRIAVGSGRSENDVKDLLKQHKQMKKMMKAMTGRGGGKMKRMMKMMGQGGPGGMPQLPPGFGL